MKNFCIKKRGGKPSHFLCNKLRATLIFFYAKEFVQTLVQPRKFLLKGFFSCGIIRVVETNVIRTLCEVYYDEKGLPFAVCNSIKLGLFG